MLQFYESHLQFNDTTERTSKKYVATPAERDDSQPEPQATNGASKVDEVEDEIEDDEEMGGVKGVATAV